MRRPRKSPRGKPSPRLPRIEAARILSTALRTWGAHPLAYVLLALVAFVPLLLFAAVQPARDPLGHESLLFPRLLVAYASLVAASGIVAPAVVTSRDAATSFGPSVRRGLGSAATALLAGLVALSVLVGVIVSVAFLVAFPLVLAGVRTETAVTATVACTAVSALLVQTRIFGIGPAAVLRSGGSWTSGGSSESSRGATRPLLVLTLGVYGGAGFSDAALAALLDQIDPLPPWPLRVTAHAVEAGVFGSLAAVLIATTHDALRRRGSDVDRRAVARTFD